MHQRLLLKQILDCNFEGRMEVLEPLRFEKDHFVVPLEIVLKILDTVPLLLPANRSLFALVSREIHGHTVHDATQGAAWSTRQPCRVDEPITNET